MARFVVGLTGGIASGKTTVAQLFATHGIAIADADEAARAAVEPGSEGLNEVIAAFGREVLAPDGSLDRAAMRRHVFHDDGARHRLESIVHPRVRVLLREACASAESPYAIAAIPLLTESGRDTYPWLARVLVVDAPDALQRARLQARDGIDGALADRMLAAQATRSARLAMADDILVNDGRADALEAHVAALDRRYRALATTAD
jgi:dephospho-CoA kinase